MEKIYCSIHNLKINLYQKDEEDLFIDNNNEESIIFSNECGKYLKRFTVNKCDLNCETIKQLLS